MALNQFGSWVATNAMRGAPMALVGMAAAAGLGFLASRGDSRGFGAGVLGGAGSGASGAMSGIILGGLAGAGVVGATMHPALRPAVGRFLGSMLGSSPVQKIAGMMKTAPTTGQARVNLEAMSGFLQQFANPQGQAAQHLMSLLQAKQASHMMYGAVPGALAGGVVGGGLGYLTGAWRGGSKLTGPMSPTY